MIGWWKNATRSARLAMAVLLLAAPAGLTACAALNPTAPSLYTLTPRAVIDPALPRVDWQLLVETPVANAAIDTPRITVTRSATSIDYFAGVSWADRAPNMIQGLLIQTFEDSGRIVSVGRDTVGLRSDFVLKTDLRDFQAEYVTPNAPFPERVHIRMAAKLVGTPQRTIEAGETFEAFVPVRGQDFTAIVNAFNEAMGAVAAELVQWTLVNGNAVYRAGGGRSR